MIVIAIVAGVAAVGSFGLHGAGQAQEAATLSRAIEFMMLQARAEAIGDGFQRQLSCTSTGCFEQRATAAGMGVPAGWTNVGNAVGAGRQSQVFAVDNTTDLTPTMPSGPLATTKAVVFFPDGSASAATVFVSDVNVLHRYKIYVFSATGMSRLVDQW